MSESQLVLAVIQFLLLFAFTYEVLVLASLFEEPARTVIAFCVAVLSVFWLFSRFHASPAWAGAWSGWLCGAVGILFLGIILLSGLFLALKKIARSPAERRRARSNRIERTTGRTDGTVERREDRR